jgi:hypothetical protein
MKKIAMLLTLGAAASLLVMDLGAITIRTIRPVDEASQVHRGGRSGHFTEQPGFRGTPLALHGRGR